MTARKAELNKIGHPAMLPLLAANAIATLAIALGLWLFAALPPALVAHLVLALGIMPLILAAMAYFVPVLTRSDAAPRSVEYLALLAWFGGLAWVVSLAVRMEALSLAIAAIGTLLAAKAAASLLFWTILRARRSLGAPHPGLAWYVAALGFLLGAGFSGLLACLGAMLFLLPLLRMGTRWSMSYADHLGRLHGPSTALGLACFGMVGLLFAGFGHALGYLNGSDALVGFAPAFLLPLVSGAAMQLLPVWLRPGRQGIWHENLRNALGRYSGVHAPLLVAGGLVVAFGYSRGLWLSAAGLVVLLAAAVRSLPWFTASEPFHKST
ncbi:MAG: hypothetical protein NTY41_09245 [Proteobacteria bacterium]|nr:hypothetical protein [Pseudomonadota bacterium]